MFVLERKFNQVIRINDEISITVLQFRDGRVTIGVQAPKDVPVMRCKITDCRIPPSQRAGAERPSNVVQTNHVTQRQKESPLGKRILATKRRNAAGLKVVHGEGEGV